MLDNLDTSTIQHRRQLFHYHRYELRVALDQKISLSKTTLFVCSFPMCIWIQTKKASLFNHLKRIPSLFFFFTGATHKHFVSCLHLLCQFFFEIFHLIIVLFDSFFGLLHEWKLGLVSSAMVCSWPKPIGKIGQALLNSRPDIWCCIINLFRTKFSFK